MRQICVQEGIDRPHASKGRERTRTESTCNDCGSILPFRKSHYVSVSRCQVCNPTHVTVECNNCGSDFELLKSVFDARRRKERGYKGKLYCTRECFFASQTRAKWWESSPIHQLTKEKKISMVKANELLANDIDQKIKAVGVKLGDQIKQWQSVADEIKNVAIMLSDDNSTSKSSKLLAISKLSEQKIHKKFTSLILDLESLIERK